MPALLLFAPVLWVLFRAPADAQGLDVVRYCQRIVNEVYLEPFGVVDGPTDEITLILETSEFAPSGSPRVARVTVVRRSGCAGEKPDTILKVTISMRDERLLGLAAEGPVISILSRVDEKERLKRIQRSLDAILAVSGWEMEGGPVPFPRDPSRDAVSFLGGDPPGVIVGFIDHASGVPVCVGMPF